ncbi:MAG: STAS-like domain-containing protein [Candidatus Woesearchaeota archaeon]
MIEIKLFSKVGNFAENKDIAKEIRVGRIVPALEKDQEVVLDFAGVDAMTQSFAHALISELIRKYGAEVLDMISFKNCTETVKKIITIVVDYMTDDLGR